MYNFLYIVMCFFIYSFLGWCSEVIYCGIVDKKIVNRGFLNGPLCPVYGFGALFVILPLNNLTNPILIFIIGVFLTTVLEYITSYILEVLFQAKWWDYSNYKYNIKGRICLLNSTLFGLLSIVLILFIHPVVSKLLNSMGKVTLIAISLTLLLILIIDMISTVYSIMKLNGKLKEIEEFISQIPRVKVTISTLKEEELNKIKGILNKTNIISRITKAFPNMKHKKYFLHFDSIKKLIEEKRHSK